MPKLNQFVHAKRLRLRALIQKQPLQNLDILQEDGTKKQASSVTGAGTEKERTIFSN